MPTRDGSHPCMKLHWIVGVCRLNCSMLQLWCRPKAKGHRPKLDHLFSSASSLQCLTLFFGRWFLVVSLTVNFFGLWPMAFGLTVLPTHFCFFNSFLISTGLPIRNGAHKSPTSLKRAGAVRIVNAFGSIPRATSAHVSGVDTPA